jgi:hypothetical protein
MQKWIIVLLTTLLGACAPHDVRCDGKLTAINGTRALAVPQDAATGRAP